jgi:hypothetical protein
VSLYNMVCGNNPLFSLYLAMLNEVQPLPEIPRFRDLYITDDEVPEIVIYTRTGGGNRESYLDENDALTKHPNFIGDYDDDFDDTFAYWHYSIPEKYLARVSRLRGLLAGLPKFAPPRQKVDAAMAALQGTKQEVTATKEVNAVEITALITELAAELKLQP